MLPFNWSRVSVNLAPKIAPNSRLINGIAGEVCSAAPVKKFLPARVRMFRFCTPELPNPSRESQKSTE